jgi:alanine dehydrogenase
MGFPDEDRVVLLPDLLAGTKPGRTSPDQITFSERGNLQGAQFHAVAGRVYEAALARGLGREIPTDWLVEDERN